MPARNLLQDCIAQKDWTQLHATLARLSRSEFKRAEHIVREQVLPRMANDDFWDALLHLVAYRPQSFLSGILAIRPLADSGRLSCDCDGARRLAATLDEDQRRKLVSMAIPRLRTEAQMAAMFRLFHIDDERSQAAMLIKEDTPLTYFLLFQALRRLADDRDFLLRCCRFLLRKGDDRALNMVSILRQYFGLDELRGRFSLRIEPHEASFVDSSFERFRYALEGKRPTII